MMEKVGVVAKTGSPLAAEGVTALKKWLEEKGKTLLLDEESASASGLDSGVTKDVLAKESDLIVVLGGDGTFLSIARLTYTRTVPILGINLGSLGFLTEFAYEDTLNAMEQVLKGDFEYEDRIMLDVSITREGRQVAFYTVLNDLVINRGSLARMVTVNVRVGDLFVNKYTCDGLIVATPTGSTAYNLAAGGPIVHPSLNAVIISPICPHTLSNRPIVLPDNITANLSMESATGEAVATLDGQVGYQLSSRDRIEVKRSDQVTRVILSDKTDYYRLLRTKLKWGEAIRHD